MMRCALCSRTSTTRSETIKSTLTTSELFEDKSLLSQPTQPSHSLSPNLYPLIHPTISLSIVLSFPHHTPLCPNPDLCPRSKQEHQTCPPAILQQSTSATNLKNTDIPKMSRNNNNNRGYGHPLNPDSEDGYGSPLPTPYISRPSSGPTKRRRAEEDEIWERENNVVRAQNIVRARNNINIRRRTPNSNPIANANENSYNQSGPSESDIQAQLLQQQDSEEEQPPRKIQRIATNTFAGSATARHGILPAAAIYPIKKIWGACNHVSGKVCKVCKAVPGVCRGVPGYLRDVQRARWARSVFESYNALVEWIRVDSGV
jgi:hypothetical protein